MLWECSECGETANERARVCPSCGTASGYTRVDAADDADHEVGSLREHWINAGAERWRWSPAAR